MMLIKASGLIPDKDNPKEMEILIENARLFYLAGGVLNFKDWAELNKSERLAFLKARESFGKDEDEKIIINKYVNRVHSLLGKN